METPMVEVTPQPTETPLPGGWSLESGTPTAGDISGLSAMSTGNCPMMGSGVMSGTSDMSGMNMTGMAGMQGGSMVGMTGMQGGSMSGMAGMQGGSMAGMTGMQDGSMASMAGMSGMTMPGMQGMTSIASANPYENPWYLLGWALLALVILAVICGVVMTILWIARRPRSTPRV
jgi:disulfide bond formation protein DsbB